MGRILQANHLYLHTTEAATPWAPCLFAVHDKI